MAPKYLISGLLVSVLVLATAGCIEEKNVLFVKADGSGTLTETTYLSPMLMQMAAGMAKAAEGQPDAPPKKDGVNPMIADMISKEKLAKKAAKIGEGTTIKSAKQVKHADGRLGAEVVYAFTDVTKIGVSPEPDSLGGNKSPGGAPGADAKKEDEKPPFRFEFQKGSPAKLTVVVPKPKDKPAAAPAEKPATQPAPDQPGGKEMAAAAQEMAKQFFKDFRLDLIVKVDGKITKTNAAKVSEAKDEVTLVSMNIGGLLSDEKAAAKFKDLQKLKDEAELRKAMKDPDLSKYIYVEQGPRVEIEFK